MALMEFINDKKGWVNPLYGVGRWSFHWWGQSWTLDASEVAEGTRALEVMEKTMPAVYAGGAGASYLSGVLAVFGPAITVQAGISAASYRLLISRIRKADEGRGVVVEMLLGYLSPSQYFPVWNVLNHTRTMNIGRVRSL